MEIPEYVIAPAMAQQMGIASVGTFHKRRGDQAMLDSTGIASAAWMRALGETHDQKWRSTIAGINYELAPRIDGRVWGIQVGLDLAGYESAWGQDRFGLFYTHADAKGTVYGNTLAINDSRSGRLSLQGDSIGGYWTHVGHSGWYLDAVVMHTWLNGGVASERGIGVGADSTAAIASFEGGIPFRLGGNWVLEPQGQIVWQRVSFDDTRDPFSSINYNSFDALTGRLGARLEGNLVVYGVPWQSFVSVDVWRNFSNTANVVFNNRNVATVIDGTSLELRGGLAIRMTANVSGYASVGYTTSLDGKDRESIGGELGVRVRW